MNTQAVFTLKGKPLNVWDLKRDIVYPAVAGTRCTISCALDIEDNIEGLRYDKVILATDADVDGLHIRNLLITYFFRFFDQVVHDQHLYVLETPLFRVRNNQETIYGYSEAERDAASAKLGGKPEITRVKGLGEISPNEFKQFIGKEMRVSQMGYASRSGGVEPANPDLLHGQEHARAEGLHHGKSGGDGGGVRPARENAGDAGIWSEKLRESPSTRSISATKIGPSRGLTSAGTAR